MFVFYSCDSNSTISGPSYQSSDSFIFVAGEGDFYTPGSGTISCINQYGSIDILENVGSIIHSVEVYEDILLVSANNDQKILVYSISEFGIEFDLEILTDSQSPRDIVIHDGKAYFPTWHSDWNVYPTIPGYVKVLDLTTFEIIESIQVGIMPEGIFYDNGYLWVANSGESSVSKINVFTNSVEVTYEVGSGPQFIAKSNNDLYIARISYDEHWNPFYGTSKISNGGVVQVDHAFSAGSACGGSIMTFDNKIYRSFDGGIAQIDSDLEIDQLSRIGSFNQSNVYHVEIVNDNIYFGITDYSDLNQMVVLNSFGDAISTFNVGKNPGDFAYWQKNTCN